MTTNSNASSPILHPKVKILHLITGLNPGGAEFMLYRLLQTTDQACFENVVVSMLDCGVIGTKIEALGFPVLSLGMRRGFPSLRGFWCLWKIMVQQKPDVLHSWMYHANLLGLLVAKSLGFSRIIWNIPGAYMDFSQYRRLTSLVVKVGAWVSSWPKAIITTSNKGREFHVQLGYHPKKWEIIPNGFNLNTFQVDPQARKKIREELNITENQKIIGCIARFDPMKDYQTLLTAARDLAQKRQDICFLLVGDGVTEDNNFFKPFLASECLQGRLLLKGHRENIPQIMAALDIATMSSYGEGFPLVVGEAMACGVPCVVTDAGDSALIVGDTGIVVPTKNPLALATAWDHLLNLPDQERVALGKRARARIEEYFELGTITQKYESFFKKVALS